MDHLKTFSSYKKTDEIDHIFPIQAFVDYGLTHEKYIKIVNGLDNLQPLIRKKNRCKKDKYNNQKFENWLKNKNINYESKNNIQLELHE